MLTREQVRDLRTALLEEFEKVSINVGFKLSLGSYSFGGNIATFKLECAALNDDGEAETKQEADFRLCSERFGVPANALGKFFTFRGRSYKIVGMKPRSYKRPFLATDALDKTFKFPPEIIKQVLAESQSNKKGKK